MLLKMKMRFLKYAGAVLLSGMLASCSFLDEVPTTSLVDENVFESEASAEATLNGLYASLVSTFAHNSYSYVFMNASPFRGWVINPIDSWLEHTVYSINGSNALIYQNIYKAIGRINFFIEGIESCDLPAEFRKELGAEAYFLRAYYYFVATRLWGDVPLILEATTSISKASRPRTPYQEVYKAILSDLDYAERNMRDYEKQESLCHGQAHVCNYAATALKAKVYVQMASYMESPYDQWFDVQSKPSRYPDFSACGIRKDDVAGCWKAALDCAKNVIENGPYELEPDYRNLFRWDPVNHPEDYLSKERILVATVTPQTPSNAWCSWSMPKLIGSDTGNNGNQMKQRPSRFTWEEWCKKYGGEEQTGSQAAIGSYHYYPGCPDPRLDATYFHTIYYTAASSEDRTPTAYNCYPYREGESQGENYVAYYTSSNEVINRACVPIFRKCFSEAYQGNGTGGNADMYHLRLADIYLLAAEAAASIDSLQAACNYVNVILKRARESVDDPSNPAPEPHDWSDTTYTDKADLIRQIMYERVFEMDHEMHSWFDSHRRGATWLSENVVKPRNAFMQEAANIRYFNSAYNKYGSLMEEDVQRIRKGLLLAFPDYELRYNTALSYADQNDFYIQ